MEEASRPSVPVRERTQCFNIYVHFERQHYLAHGGSRKALGVKHVQLC
jgi:hypothetical protein